MKVYIAQMYEVEEAKEQRLCSLLDNNRAQKVSGFQNRKERTRSIFAGLLLRYAFLQEGYGIDAWQQVEIIEGTYGKPYLKGYSAFHYSLSHSGEWVACAVDTMPVGIDIQEIKSWKMTLASFLNPTQICSLERTRSYAVSVHLLKSKVIPLFCSVIGSIKDATTI